MNPKLGDVGFKVGGKTYILNMGVNALCFIEHQSGEPASDVLDRIDAALPKQDAPIPSVKMRVSDVRLLFWGGLQRHHSGLDAEAAGDLMAALGKAARSGPRAIDLILESVGLCAPEREEANGDADPPPAPAPDAGTGTPSS